MIRLLRVSYTRYVLLFCCLGSLLLTACGLDSFIYLEKPQRLAHDPSNLADLSARYCEFRTADARNTVAVGTHFQGTEIYYRIYERKTDCENARNQISQYNENNPFSAAYQLETTWKYHRLETNQSSKRPLIGSHSSDVIVRFRLQDYGSPVIDPISLTVNGASQGIPYRDGRISNDKRAFNKQNIDVGDGDVQRASSSSGVNEYWYISFYAVSYGYTTTFSILYSQLEYLGYIQLEKNP